MRTAMMLLAATLAMSAGCKKKGGDTSGSAGSDTGSAMMGSGSAIADAGSGSDAADGGAGSGSAGATGVGSAGSGAASGSASDGGIAAGSAAAAPGAELLGTHRARNCPSTVVGSTTTGALQDKSIVLTITGSSPDVIKTIQARATALLAEKKDGTTGMAHDAKGTHGGAQGICPVYVPEGATAAMKIDPKGVLVTITPKDNLDALKTDIDGRIQRAADWVKANLNAAPDAGRKGDGTGGGHGDGTGGGTGKGSGAH